MTAWEDVLPSDLLFDDSPPLSELLLDVIATHDLAAIDGLAETGGPNAQTVVGWSIDDDDLAEWAGRRLSAARARRAEIADRADRYHAKIDAWFNGEVEREDRTIAYFEGRLADYGLRQREAGRKTVNLPSVRIRTSGPAAGKPPVRVGEIRDPQRLYELLEEHNLLALPAGEHGEDVELVAVLSPKIDKRALGKVVRFAQMGDGWEVLLDDEIVSDVVDVVAVTPSATVDTP